MSEVRLRFHRTKDIGKPGTLEAILDVLQALGCHVADGHVGDLFRPVVRWVIPGMPPVDEDVRRGLHIAYEYGHLAILVAQDYSDEYRQLGFWLELKWEYDSSGHLSRHTSLCTVMIRRFSTEKTFIGTTTLSCCCA
jgi:hypothetical protein